MKRRMKIGMMGIIFSLTLLTALGAAFADDYLTADGGSGLELDFGSAPIDSSKTMDLDVTNQTGQEMKLIMTLSHNTCCVYSTNCPAITYLGGGQTMIVEVTYQASNVGVCEGSLYILYSGSSSGTVVVGLKGAGVEAEAAPPEQEKTVMDTGDTVTEDPDPRCKDRLLRERICKCRKGKRNHGEFVHGVSRQANALKRERMLSGHQKGALQRRVDRSRFR